MVCIVRAAHQFDFRFVISETPDNRQLVDRRSCIDSESCFWQDMYVFCHRRHEC